MKTYDKVVGFIKNFENVEKIENLHQRWQDEREYEDWTDYENVMKDMWNGEEFIKGTKRPLGFKVKDSKKGCIYHIKLKVTKTTMCLWATYV